MKRILAAVAGLVLLAGCASAPPAATTGAGPTSHSTVATHGAPGKTLHITLKATVTGDGEAAASYAGDPTDPDGGVEPFTGSWQREFDIGYMDWAAINKVELKVTERSNKNVRVDCTILYDDTVGGHGHKTGPGKTTRCIIAYGDVGDDNPDDTD